MLESWQLSALLLIGFFFTGYLMVASSRDHENAGGALGFLCLIGTVTHFGLVPQLSLGRVVVFGILAASCGWLGMWLRYEQEERRSKRSITTLPTKPEEYVDSNFSGV